MMANNVTHPTHYTSHPSGVECITIAQHHNFNIGNAIKYLWRAGVKDEVTHVQDLEKARQYIDFEITRLTAQNAPSELVFRNDDGENITNSVEERLRKTQCRNLRCVKFNTYHEDECDTPTDPDGSMIC